MIRLEITADNPSDFQHHLAFVAGAFLRPGENPAPQDVSSATYTVSEAAVATPTADPSPPLAEPVEEPFVPAEPMKRRGRPKRAEPAPITIEGTAVEVQPEAADAPKYELDDLRRRMKEIVSAGTKAGKDMPAVMVLMKAWFDEMGITRVKDVEIKDDPAATQKRCVDFMQRSEAVMAKAAA